MNTFKKLILIATFIMALSRVYGQITPFGASFFRTQYLNNPAMAGVQKGLNASISYRQQFNSIPGAPVNQGMTIEYGSQKNAGIGLNIQNDKSGLFKTTRVVTSYSYALRLSDQKRLLFGLSAGFLSQRISNEDVDGDPNDFKLAEFNQRETYMDGDFGLAYTDNRFSLQFALPQLKNHLGKEEPNIINYPTFFSSVGYKFELASLMAEAEPRLNYRGIAGADNIADFGINLTFSDRKLNLFGMYHSSGSMSFGTGVSHQNMSINCIYSTGTSLIRKNANGDFEINLQLEFPNKK